MTTAEKLTTIAENQHRVYEAGQKSVGAAREVVGNPAQLDCVHATEHALDVRLISDTITDFSGVKVYRYGKNLLHLDGREVVDFGASSVATKRTFTGNGIMLGVTRSNNYIPSRCSDVVVGDNTITGRTTHDGYGIGLDARVLPNTKYTFSYAEYTGYFSVGQYNADGEYLTYAVVSNTDNTFTTHADAAWCLFVFGGDDNGLMDFANPQIERGRVYTGYEPGVAPVEYTAGKDGALSGMQSLSPTTILIADSAGVQVAARYYTDGNGASDRFWDVYQHGGRRAEYQYAFAGRGWRDDTFNPKYPLDTGVITNANNMFNASEITEIGHISFENAISCTTTFANSTALTTIKGIAFPENYTVGISNMFQACSSLKELMVLNAIANSIDLKSCPLSRESILSVLDHLYTATSTKTVTFKQTAVEAAFGAAEWDEIVGEASARNWDVALL